MEQRKQCQHINNLCFHCGKLNHVAHECLKKHGPHVAHAIFVTNPQPGELRNKDG
jgi:hypothetical protein